MNNDDITWLGNESSLGLQYEIHARTLKVYVQRWICSIFMLIAEKKSHFIIKLQEQKE